MVEKLPKTFRVESIAETMRGTCYTFFPRQGKFTKPSTENKQDKKALLYSSSSIEVMHLIIAFTELALSSFSKVAMSTRS